MTEKRQDNRDLSGLRFEIREEPTNDELNGLFAESWPDHASTDFVPVLTHSLTYVACRSEGELVGFVNVAWDGGVHAFLLDTTVRPDWRRRLVEIAAAEAAQLGMQWLHVDYTRMYEPFYRRCGFRPTLAGLIDLSKR